VERDRLVIAFRCAVAVVLASTVAQQTSYSAPPSTVPLSQVAAEFAPFVFIHAGDPELGSPDLAGTSRRFGQLAKRANTIGAALVVIAGDLVHGGTDVDDLKALDEGLTAFKMPVRAVPGNHDNLAAFRKRFGPENSVFTFHNCDFVCLNSNDLSALAMAWLENALKASVRRGRTHVFVAMHHPPQGNTAMDELFARHGVTAVLCGHLHKTGSATHRTYTTYWVSGTAKARDDEGLRYNVFTVHKDRIEQESLPLDKAISKREMPYEK
jgi:3',5'-cyclic AMP phosphodiesterase CpdA